MKSLLPVCRPRTFSVLLFACTALTAQTAYAGPLSEDEALARAAALPETAALDTATGDAAKADAQAVRRFENPELLIARDRVSGSLGTETEWTAEVTQPLGINGANGRLRAAAAAAAEAQAVDADITRRKAIRLAEVRKAYAECGAAGERAAILTEQDRRLREVERIISLRARAGDAAGYDLRRVRLETHGVAAQKTLADGEVRAACATLSRLSETPGIFRVLVRASEAGNPRLRLTLVSKGKTSVHDLGPVEVYATRELAENANPEPPENPNRIAFSKEVQWKTPFLTAPATSGELAETIPVLIDVRYAPDAEAVIAAPVAGIVRTGANFPAPGSSIRQGQQLATLSAQLGAGEDVASLDLGVAQARIAADAARRDVSRLQGLYAQEAVPLRRVQEAQSSLRLAQAQLAAASGRRGSLGSGPIKSLARCAEG